MKKTLLKITGFIFLISICIISLKLPSPEINQNNKDVTSVAVDETTNINIEEEVDDIEMGIDLVPIVQNGLTGYIDKTGKIVIKPQYISPGPTYDRITYFQEGLAKVNNQDSLISERVNNQYINKKGGDYEKTNFIGKYDLKNNL